MTFRRETIADETQIPLPIETAYFLRNNSTFQAVRDEQKCNRFWFNYPPEWKTSNIGEKIIGVRSIWTLLKTRRLNFNLVIRKYRKRAFYETAKKVYKEYENMTLFEFLNIAQQFDDDKIQTIVNEMPQPEVMVKVVSFNQVIPNTMNWNDIYNLIDESIREAADCKKLALSIIYDNFDMVFQGMLTPEERIEVIQTYKQADSDEIPFQLKHPFWLSQRECKISNANQHKDIVMTTETNDKEIHVSKKYVYN